MSRWLRLTSAAGLALLGACLDGIEPKPGSPSPNVDSIPGLSVSAAVQGSASAGSVRGSTASLDRTLAYVSLEPGAVPTGVKATIHNRVSGESVSTPIVDGGFDPVAIPANAGDTLLVEISRLGSAGTLVVAELVAARRPPVVVRTNPPPRKVDVPLNSIIVVVFSAPIDPATLTSESVQLFDGATQISGALRLTDASGVRAEFDPDALLSRETLYDLIITTAIHDLTGTALPASLDVQFTTGVDEEPLAFAALSVAGGHTCGVIATGAVYCWGVNTEGQLGTATDLDCGVRCSTIPVAVAGGLTFQSVSAGNFHTCGVTANGAAYCWGDNSYGVLGADTAITNPCYALPYAGGCPYPVPVAGGLTFRSISAGYEHTCGVTTQGAAYCWGANLSGALGADSATLAQNCRTAFGCRTPVPVSGGHNFTVVSAGKALSCGVTTGGAAYCWGSNASGELGIGTAVGPEHCGGFPAAPLDSCSRVPVEVEPGLVFTAITALDVSACGLTIGGHAYCWGHNAGLIGTDLVPLDSSAATPVPVGYLNYASLAAGFQYACGVRGTGAALCWGVGDNGVFGNGTTTHISATPLGIAGGHLFQILSAANGVLDHTCGLTLDGVAYCWGSNLLGELGDGSTNSSVVPVPVVGQAGNR